MTSNEIQQQLQQLRFTHDKFAEYENTFRNTNYNGHDIEVMIDYYTVRLVLWYNVGRKVSKSYYVKTDIDDFANTEELINDFLTCMWKIYGVG